MIEFKKPEKYVPALQVLRAVAAWAVVMCHYNQVFFSWNMSGSFLGEGFGHVSRYYGPLGVDVFFVISGFIIFLSAENAVSVKNFFLNRASRIVPPYWFFTLILLVLVIFFPESNKTEVYWNFESILKSLFFVYHENPSPYLGEYPFLTVGWTLNYEVMFYLLCVLFLMMFRKWWALPLVILLLFSRNIWAFEYLEYFFDSKYIREFAWGMIIGFVYRKGFIPNNNYVGLMVLLVSIFFFYTGGAQAYKIPAITLLIVAAMSFKNEIYNNCIGNFFQHLGNISYSTYLAHGAVSFSVCLSLFGENSVYPNEALLLLTYILVTYCCSVFGYSFVENNKFNRWVRRL